MKPIFTKPWFLWLAVFVGLLIVAAAAYVTLVYRDLHDTANVVAWATAILASAWCYFGLFKARGLMHRRALLAGLLATNILWLAAVLLHDAGHVHWSTTLIGAWMLSVVSFGGVWGTRLLLAGRQPIFAIARNVITEASRYYIVPIVVIVLVLMILFLPRGIDDAERPDYRVAFYLTWSLRLMALLLSLMTVLLGCWTVCRDQSQKQVFMIASKPISRAQYLFGKWLGLGMLNLVLIVITGLGVWIGANFMATRPLPATATAEDHANQQRIGTDVLTARITAAPRPIDRDLLNRHVQEQFEDLQQEFPDQFPAEATVDDLDVETLEEFRGKALAEWHTIEPTRDRVFVFDGLGDYKERFKAQLEAHDAAVEQQIGRIVALANADAKEGVERAAQLMYIVSVLNARLPEWTFNLLIPNYESGSREFIEQILQRVEAEGEEQAAERRQEVRRLLAQLIAMQPPESGLRIRMRPKQPNAAPDDRVRMQVHILGVRQDVEVDDRDDPANLGLKATLVLPPIPEDTAYEHRLSPLYIEDDGRLIIAIRNIYVTPIPEAEERASWISERNRGGLGRLMSLAVRRYVDQSDWRRRIAIEQPTHQANINFEPMEGLTVLYTAGSFEGNLARGMIVHWLRLSSLAMVAILGGTFLGLPMACLFGLFVYGICALSGFAQESLHYYVSIPTDSESTWDIISNIFRGMGTSISEGEFGQLFKLFMKLLGESVLAVVPSFTYYNPTHLLADGRMVPWRLVGETLLVVGGWTVADGVIAWLIYRKRELASVTV